MTERLQGTLKEFWSDIRNVQNATPEDIQSDVLTYLDLLFEKDATIKRLEQQLNAVNEGIDDGPQFGMTAWDWQDWLYSTLPFLKEPLGEGDKE